MGLIEQHGAEIDKQAEEMAWMRKAMEQDDDRPRPGRRESNAADLAENAGVLESHVVTKQRALEKTAMLWSLSGSRKGSTVDPSVVEGVKYEFETLVNALETPSIYLIQAVRVELPAEHRAAIDLIYCTIVFIQVIFPSWFICNYASRRRPLLIAPGFHHKRKQTAQRVHWLHNFATDFSASVFFGYLAWKLRSGPRADLYRIFLAKSPSPGDKLHRPTLFLGLIANFSTAWCVIFMIYVRASRPSRASRPRSLPLATDAAPNSHVRCHPSSPHLSVGIAWRSTS